MKNKMLGTPGALKQVNLSAVRRAIREKGSATRAEIVAATQISVTTVRTLLTELQEQGELLQTGYDDSIGGRRAVRYALNKECFFGVALCLTDPEVYYLVVDICGEVQESGHLPTGADASQTICALLDELAARLEIRSIGIGVPGIVEGMGYRRQNKAGELEYCPLGETLRRRYGLPVVLENDLNAITLGFGRCYLSQYPEERCENVNMGYLSFEAGCLSAGFLANGRVLRGWNNFVGELGLFPVGEGQTLDDLLASPLSDSQYASLVARVLAGICCVLNPQYIAVGGEGFRKHCLPLILEHFTATLPKAMSAEIVYAEDKWHDYFGGMAYLTSEHIFDDVLLVKGQV